MEPLCDLVLFDLDGTLSDPLEGIGRSINFALSHFGYAERPLAELAAHVGPPLDEAFASITGVREHAALEALVAKYRERYAAVGYSENRLYEGIPEVLHRLAEAGMPMGLCTTKRADFAERILEMFGLRSYFSFISGGEIGIHKWQQVRALLETRIITQSTIMVGDRAVDVVAGHRNGLHVAAVLWGHGSRRELEAEHPRYLFSRPEELLALLGHRGRARGRARAMTLDT